MPYFIKKMVTVEARRFETNNEPDDLNMNALCEWIGGAAHHDGTSIYIKTLEGEMRADVGDWIIRGVAGEFYPCKSDIFDATYDARPEIPVGFTFSDVVAGLKRGRRYARAGWNGKGMFIFLVPGSRFKANREPLLSILGEGTEVDYHGHVDMRTATGQIVPWLCSQTDMLADDWEEA